MIKVLLILLYLFSVNINITAHAGESIKKEDIVSIFKRSMSHWKINYDTLDENKSGKKLGLLGGAPSRPGQVRQSFSHGRSKSVVVETKRKRVVVPKHNTGTSQTNNSQTTTYRC